MIEKVEAVEAGAAVLAQKLGINCMKIDFAQRPRLINNEILYPYNIERGGIAVIDLEMPPEDRPDKFLNECCIYFQKGDCVNGIKLWGLADKPNRKRNIGTSDVRSGRHSRQELEIKGKICYAVIITSWNKDNINPHPLEYIKQETIEVKEIKS